jgi:hypothetical protein
LRPRFGRQFAQSTAEEDTAMRHTNDQSFGVLPWVSVLLTALVVLIAYVIATR